METRKRISRSVLSAIAFFGTLGILSVGYSAYSGLSAVTSETPLTVALWTQVKDNFDDLNSRTSSISASGGNVGIGTTTPSSKLHVNGVITADNVNQAPIISPSRAADYTSSAAGWQYIGTSATVTVPSGPNRKYRVTMKAMAY